MQYLTIKTKVYISIGRLTRCNISHPSPESGPYPSTPIAQTHQRKELVLVAWNVATHLSACRNFKIDQLLHHDYEKILAIDIQNNKEIVIHSIERNCPKKLITISTTISTQLSLFCLTVQLQTEAKAFFNIIFYEFCISDRPYSCTLYFTSYI